MERSDGIPRRGGAVQRRPVIAGAGAAALAAVAIGCGDTAPDDRPTAQRGATTAAQVSPGEPPTPPVNPAKPAKRRPPQAAAPDPADPADRPPPKTLPDGTVIIPPPAITAEEAEPGAQCIRRENGLVPPAPGLRARMASARSVEITLTTPAVAPACRVVHAEITVDVADDEFPGYPVAWAIGRPGQLRRTLRLPRWFKGTPDTVHASVSSTSHRISKVVSVHIGA